MAPTDGPIAFVSDIYTPEKRSAVMARVRGSNTKPEVRVRSLLHRLGYRFRLHRKDLPGRPDIVLPKHRAVVFVHGCFWHRHPACKKATLPKNNREEWEAKLARNVERDAENVDALEQAGWSVGIVWECDSRDPGAIVSSLVNTIPDIRDRYERTDA